MRDGTESQQRHLLAMIETAQRRGHSESQIAAMVERELGPGSPNIGDTRRRPKKRLFGLLDERRAA